MKNKLYVSYYVVGDDCPNCGDGGVFPVDESLHPVPSRFAIKFECINCLKQYDFIQYYKIKAEIRIQNGK